MEREREERRIVIKREEEKWKEEKKECINGGKTKGWKEEVK